MLYCIVKLKNSKLKIRKEVIIMPYANAGTKAGAKSPIKNEETEQEK